ncbi:MAG: glycosyltransferase family 4 protein [Melioribacteraceae bacterium]|nr:glycosyltransferase family 4 protein [Melioribacteraceae bacterium]
MEKQSIKVLHIDTEKDWRGGQQQVAYLHEHLFSEGIDSFLVCKYSSKLGEYSLKHNLPYKEIPIHSEADLIAAFKISRICRLRGINIIHCHSAHALSIGILVKLFCSNVKLIGVRRVDFNIGKSFISKWKYNSAMVNKIVCISDKIRDVLINNGIDSSKLCLIHSGVKTDKFNKFDQGQSFRREYGIDSGKMIVGTIAAFVGHKDYSNLLHAAKEVLDKNKNTVFVAVGDGKLYKEIIELSEKLGLDPNFIFTGQRSDTIRLLKSFDVFVLASKKEGLGTSLLDAQAAGIPVIATETGGIPEIITHGINGILVPPKDSKKLADAIIFILSNNEVRNKLASEARETVKRFDISSTVEKNIKLYLELLEE